MKPMGRFFACSLRRPWSAQNPIPSRKPSNAKKANVGYQIETIANMSVSPPDAKEIAVLRC